MAISLTDKQGISSALQSRGAATPMCPCCQGRAWELADGYISEQLQSDAQNYTLGGLMMPTAAVVCSCCGFVRLHALGSLGLMPQTADSVQ